MGIGRNHLRRRIIRRIPDVVGIFPFLEASREFQVEPARIRDDEFIRKTVVDGLVIGIQDIQTTVQINPDVVDGNRGIVGTLDEIPGILGQGAPDRTLAVVIQSEVNLGASSGITTHVPRSGEGGQ